MSLLKSKEITALQQEVAALKARLDRMDAAWPTIGG
jgi:hypothetical protein